MPSAPPGNGQPDRVNIQFPRTSVFEVLSLYETLTGKRLIRDSNLAGPELSIMVAQPVPRAEAIAIIESSLLLNGYSIVPVDDATAKILGPGRAPRTEGLPLYVDADELPDSGDKIVSFYKPLTFVSPDEATNVIQGVVQINAFGSVIPVTNTNALIITDKTPVIRKALAVLNLIDVEPARVVTEFVSLQRASAERIVEILGEMFGKDDASKASSTPRRPNQPNQPNPNGQPGQPNNGAPSSGARYENRLIAGKAQFLADKRTNRILVVTRQENFRYLRDVILQLDAAGSFEEPYVRPLNFVPVNDIFPVLTDMLADAETEKKESSSGQGQGSQSRTNKNSQNQQQNSTMGGGSSGTGSLGRPDRLTEENEQAAPLSATLGEIRLIGDNSSNTIIVFGPPESKQRTRQILDILDRRPKQVYLAVVIGQLRVGDNLDYGVNYIVKYQNFQPLQQLLGNSNTSGAAATALSPTLFSNMALPVASNLTGAGALTPAMSTLSGLTIYGAIADSVDVYARFLESTNRFRTLSRPVIYTTNNRKATILSGQKVPVPTQSTTTATGGGVSGNGSAITSNIQYQDVVLKLEVIPLINSNREVSLTIAQTNDSIVGMDTISGNQVPRISTQEITTSVRISNGSTIVLGGLITENKDTTKEGIPVIGQIPVLGSLLGGRTNKKVEKNELIVLIQPVVVDSDNEALRASASEGDRTDLGMDAQAVTAPVALPARTPLPYKPTPSPTPRKKKSWWPLGNNGQSR